MTFPPYPKFDEVLRALLGDLAAVVTYVDDNTPDPYILVNRVGGKEDGIKDNPLIDIQYVAATRDASKTLAETGQERIRFAGNTSPGGYLIDTADESAGGLYIPPYRRDHRGVTETIKLSYRRARS
jgi:hypothetical protein